MRVRALNVAWVVVALGCVVSVVFSGALGCGTNSEAPAPYQVPTEWQLVRQSVGHLAHLRDTKITCQSCHDTNFGKPATTVCATCHKDHTELVHGQAQPSNTVPLPSCLQCHRFGAGTTVDAKNIDAAAQGVAQGRADATAACMQCHQQAQATAHAIRMHSKADCVACHPPHRREGKMPTLATCVSCHTSSATAHGDQARRMRCEDCHLPHQPKAAAMATCATCHTERASALTAEHKACTDCHASHDFSRAATKPCAACHDRVFTLAVAKHGSCVSCHDPHQPKVKPRCETCHAQAAQQVQHTATHGASCTGCHPPHAAATRNANAVGCTSCHADIAPHGNAPCAACHQPHQGKPQATPALCANCHDAQAQAPAQHGNGARPATHPAAQSPVHPAAPSDAATGPTNSRASAHGPGHRDCVMCHRKPGHHAAAPVPRCGACHLTQGQQLGPHGALASSSSVVHAGPDEKACAACHRELPHRPGAPATDCASCHPAQRKTAPAGHRDCGQCHRNGQHQPSAPPVNCKTCHVKPASTGHGRHDCATCHRPHGPNGVATPPACTSCHASGALPGLHAVPQHRANCAPCHLGGHDPAPHADRATCAACHQLPNHQPAAKTCQGCHPFAAARSESP